MTVRPDNRLADGAMQSVGCEACGARVEVRKSSWEQTSVQWHADALEACIERRAASPRPGPNGTAFSGVRRCGTPSAVPRCSASCPFRTMTPFR